MLLKYLTEIQDVTVVICSTPSCPLSNMLFLPHVASGAGVEACNHCAEGYLMEEWRCVPSCSAGFYAIEPNPEIADGQRICRRWALWCVFRCGWVVYLLTAGLVLVVGFCVCACLCFGCLFSHLCWLLCACMGLVFFCVCFAWYVCLFVHVFSLGVLLFRCDASCLTCAGPSQGNCSSCSSGHSLQEGVCVVNTVCTDGQSTIFFVYYVSAHCS